MSKIPFVSSVVETRSRCTYRLSTSLETNGDVK